jgi:hypothetical protein
MPQVLLCRSEVELDRLVSQSKAASKAASLLPQTPQ